MQRRPFFGLHLNLGAKFWTEIELLSLTKLRKNILPPLESCVIYKRSMPLIFAIYKDYQKQVMFFTNQSCNIRYYCDLFQFMTLHTE